MLKRRDMGRAFSYVVKRDYGFAPNPFYGVLTLATCKPRIRKSAEVGDFIIGNAGSAHDNRLIYMAKVTEVTTFDKYWEDPRFKCKKPVMNGSLRKLYGDNIYHHDDNDEWIQEDSHHANNDGTVNVNNLNKDTGSTDRVLICEDFIYFGKSMIAVPDTFQDCIHKGIGHNCPDYSKAEALWSYLKQRYPEQGKVDNPNLFDKFERYDGVS